MRAISAGLTCVAAAGTDSPGEGVPRFMLSQAMAARCICSPVGCDDIRTLESPFGLTTNKWEAQTLPGMELLDWPSRWSALASASGLRVSWTALASAR